MVQKSLPEREVRRLVSHHAVTSIDAGEERAVEEAILKARHGDGNISLRQIYDVLQGLYNKRIISLSDKRALMKIFKEYFERRFS